MPVGRGVGNDVVVATRVEVEAPARELRLVLRAGGQVMGTVVSSRGEPLPEVDLSLFADATQPRGTASVQPVWAPITRIIR